MAREVPTNLFLVRYTDYTVDVVALHLDEVQGLRDRKGVKNIVPMGAETELNLDSDYLFKRHQEEDDNDN